MALQFKFDPDQPHQIEGVRNVIDLFEGLPKAEVAFQLGNEIIPNHAEDADLFFLEDNLRVVQQRHNERHPDAVLEAASRLDLDDGALLEGVSNDSYGCPHFTLEMETGTGKTYVYFRTMLDLFTRYGLRKFIIVVPSVAILEGVKKTFEVTRGHFTSLYGVTNLRLYEYDGALPGRIGSFARDTYPAVMVITQQSFNRASNNFFKPTEKLPGELRPYQWVQAVRPIVILDEPQNMGSPKAQEAIRTLKPLFVLRYSATHRHQPNPVYRLTPVQAFRLGLVKQIEVIGVAELGNLTTNLLRLEEVKRNPIQARVRVLALEKGQTREQVVTLRQGDLLRKHTKLAEHEGLKVANIVVGTGGDPSRLELSGGPEGGLVLTTSDEVVGSRVDVWRAQIEKTIETHFQRQQELRSLGVKVLSLFFIDRVANYIGEPGVIRQLFDECFERMKARDPYWARFEAEQVRSGYFAKTTKKDRKTKETRDFYDDNVKSDSDEARAAFKLIMQKKETLLSFPDGRDPDKNVAFIFAHSALKEGWDNPNVFQICTLNQTTSQMKKRQEIGRGLRLCVDQEGNRPEGASINVLTVIANESYESYVRNLQQDYLDDGVTAPPPPKRPAEAKAKRRDTLYRQPLFEDFWRRLCQRLDYTIEIDTPALIAECVRRLDGARFPEPVLTISRGRFVVVEYLLRAEAVEGRGRARVIVEARSSAGAPTALAFIEPEVREPVVKVGDDLARLCGNPHLRGFKVMQIAEQYGEVRVRFANDVEVSPSERHRFQATRIDDSPARETVLATESHPVPDFIGRAAEETHLTRETLVRIFEGVSLPIRARLFRNPEGWANTFVAVVKEALADHIADRVRYHWTGEFTEHLGNVEALFPAVGHYPQKELLEGGPKSLYDRVQVDSEVERAFVNQRLRADEDNLVFFFKFPPSFKIRLPRVIQNYNPDWGIVRREPEGGYTIELVRETKGNDDLAKLRFANEERKIKVARRYFAELGIDYRPLSPAVARYWESEHAVARAQGKQLRLMRTPPPPGHRAVPVYDLRAAAGAFSAGQVPAVIGHVHLPDHVARGEGLFVARIEGDSMERVAPDGAWCLWQHLRAPGVSGPGDGDRVIAVRVDAADSELGEYTFKRLREQGGKRRLVPMSYNPAHQPIEEGGWSGYIARFVTVVDDVALA